MGETQTPRYPDIVVQVPEGASVFSATYLIAGAMRRAGVSRAERDDFATEAFDTSDPTAVARKWVTVK